ncbi:guanine nucleotide-binding protein g(o) subunit alpha [Anaeramoeba flamelloides]|uniref:Guanine nucleotide-binding protein g(O) subunit alpha n=1 Tax=Anaeramoeba flamelloides TaxID=1746091 RepID=A0ABQ8YCH8_9EUKA|nr:guanine nucleotide-binding protein g(o) subunit alpha [Anaeramoeba flamelloides]
MGNNYSTKKKKIKDLKKQKQRNDKIDKELTPKNIEKKGLTILLLGTGESGKSTVIKQMMILHKGGFKNSDFVTYQKTIRANLILHMKTLLEASSKLDYQLESNNKEIAKEFLSMASISLAYNEEKAELVKQLWQDKSLQLTFESRSKYQIPDTAKFFLNKIEEIMKTDYRPTDQDILFCRIPTTGVNQLTFEQGNTIWKIIDVGGQRSERRKWIHQFENVDLLIYIVALNEYDQKLFENLNVNRLSESLELFTRISNNAYFENKNCIIFFNKIDLFEEKIKKSDVKQCFPDYSGGLDFENGKEFIKQKFIDKAENMKRNIFTHFTCATNTKNIERVIDAVNITAMEYILKEDGFL